MVASQSDAARTTAKTVNLETDAIEIAGNKQNSGEESGPLVEGASEAGSLSNGGTVKEDGLEKDSLSVSVPVEDTPQVQEQTDDGINAAIAVVTDEQAATSAGQPILNRGANTADAEQKGVAKNSENAERQSVNGTMDTRKVSTGISDDGVSVSTRSDSKGVVSADNTAAPVDVQSAKSSPVNSSAAAPIAAEETVRWFAADPH